MRLLRYILPAGIAGVLAVSAPLVAYASSPEFSRTAEEWAQLRDDKIEYSELAGLVHEYNATVQKDQIDYNGFRKKYGDTKEDVADEYRKLAADLRDALSYPDVDDSNYGSMMAQIINNNQTAKTYEEKADDALEDSYVKYMTNCQTEAGIVQSAQSEMISWYQNQIQLQVDQKAKELAQENYQAVEARRNAGMATDIEVLSARESLRSTDQALINDQSAIDTGRQKLQVMLGWSANANPEIGSIPDVNDARITEMNPSVDKDKALENNYTLLINKRQLSNARSQDKKDDLTTTVADNERAIVASVNSSYQSVLSAKTAYDLSVTQATLEQQNLQIAQRKAQTGQLDNLSLKTQQNTTETAELTVQINRYKLFQAIQNYEWTINGLAGT